jgi:hypothetical protein
MPLPSGMPSPELGADPLLTANAINDAINANIALIIFIILPFCELNFDLVVVSKATKADMSLLQPLVRLTRH